MRLGLALAMMVGASLRDLRTRRVPNVYWVPFIAAAGALWLGDLVVGAWSLAGLLWALGTTAFLYAIWWLGLFGGADAKGLMVLAWLWPVAPDPLVGTMTPTMDALINGTFAVAAVPALFLVWNLLRGDLRMPAALLGVRMDLQRARRRFVWPMEDGERFRYMHRPGTDPGPTFDRLEAQGRRRIWVTPKVPFMIPLTVGLVLHALHGNLVLRAMAAWLRP